ncbi:MAG: hypothetical protein IPN66_06490 [Candidatus Competibacteraceae bacterium]|nr:hypothetical protein [Candidatus Competibacteraceae bacterium]MBK8896864.1 hypothetical protein [Candidatus Competibacteraceae bacterium]
MKATIDANDILKLIAHRPGIGYADLRELCGCGSDLVSRLCKSLRDAGRVMADKRMSADRCAPLFTPQAWLAAQMQAERAAGFPAEKSGGHPQATATGSPTTIWPGCNTTSAAISRG